jgi:putative membrane protein
MNNTCETPTDPRIYLAAERTFLAWIRTGIAFMGFGFVVARFGLFLHEIALNNQVRLPPQDRGFSLPVGIALIVAGVLISLIAALRYRRYVRALDRGESNPAHGLVFSFSVAGFLAVIGLAVVFYLAFLLR